MSQHVSQQLKSNALNNINAKHRIIKEWIESGIPWASSEQDSPLRDANGELVLDWYPTSIRKFCAWNGTQNCLTTQNTFPGISTTGFDTLVKHQQLKSQVETDIAVLKKVADIQTAKANKSNLIRALKEELKLEKLKRQSTQVSYQQTREEITEVARKLETEKRTHLQAVEYLKSEIFRRDKQISVLNQKVADLTASLDKVAPIRKVED